MTARAIADKTSKAVYDGKRIIVRSDSYGLWEFCDLRPYMLTSLPTRPYLLTPRDKYNFELVERSTGDARKLLNGWADELSKEIVLGSPLYHYEYQQRYGRAFILRSLRAGAEERDIKEIIRRLSPLEHHIPSLPYTLPLTNWIYLYQDYGGGGRLCFLVRRDFD